MLDILGSEVYFRIYGKGVMLLLFIGFIGILITLFLGLYSPSWQLPAVLDENALFIKWKRLSLRHDVFSQLLKWLPAFIWPVLFFAFFIATNQSHLNRLQVWHVAYRLSSLPATVVDGNSFNSVVYYPGTYKMAKTPGPSDSDYVLIRILEDTALTLDLSNSRYFTDFTKIKLNQGDTLTLVDRNGDHRKIILNGHHRLSAGQMTWSPYPDTIPIWKYSILRSKPGSKSWWNLMSIYAELDSLYQNLETDIRYVINFSSAELNGYSFDQYPVYVYAKDSLWVNGQPYSPGHKTIPNGRTIVLRHFKESDKEQPSLLVNKVVYPKISITYGLQFELAFDPPLKSSFLYEDLTAPDKNSWQLEILPEGDTPPIADAVLTLSHLQQWTWDWHLVIQSPDENQMALLNKDDKLEGDADYLVKTSQGYLLGEFGVNTLFGASQGPVFLVDEGGRTWYYLFLVLIASMLPLLYTSLTRSVASIPLARALIVVVMFLTVLKVIFSIQVLIGYPYQQEPLEIAVFALFVVPFIIWITIAWFARQLQLWIMVELIAVMLIIGCLLFDSDALKLLCGLVLSFVLMCLLVWKGQKHLSLFSFLKNQSPLRYLLTLSIGASFIIGLMFIAGIREAIYWLGPRMQVSIVTLPLAILAICYPTWRYLNARKGLFPSLDRNITSWSKPAFMGMIFLVWWILVLAYSYISSDAGFFLAYCLPLGGVILLVLAFGTTGGVNFSKWLRDILISGVLPVLAVVIMFGLRIAGDWIGVGALEKLNYNVLRVMAQFQPDLLSQIGTQMSERISTQMEMLRIYSESGFFGYGFSVLPIMSDFDKTALNDNFMAILVIGNFGYLGLLFFLGTFSLIPLLIIRAVERSARITLLFSDWVAMMMSLAVLMTALYMALANSQVPIALYTGKNVPLFGLNSWSDLIQFLVMMLISIIPIIRFARIRF